MEYKRNLRLGVEGYTDDELSLDVYGNVNVSGNISVAGTVTYDDVTNIDAIGLVTARSGIDIGYPGTATTLTADGNAVFSGIVTAAQFFGDGSGLDGVTGVSIVAQEVTGDPVYPTFASNVGVTTLGIAQTGFVYVPSTGSVGIGTTNPTEKLSVTGNTLITGNLNVGVGGTIITTTGIGSVGIGSTQPGSTLVLNAPSGYTGNVLDLQVGGSSKLKFNELGYGVNGAYRWGVQNTQGSTSDFLFFIKYTTHNYPGCAFGDISSTPTFAVDTRGIFGWANSNAQSGQGVKNLAEIGTRLYRDATGIIGQRNGSTPNTFRVYNTYTSATNFERANVGWTTNTFIVGTEKGVDGGTARQLELQTDGTTRVAITTDGYVGIGSTQPGSTLVVNAPSGSSGNIINATRDGDAFSAFTLSRTGVAFRGNASGGNVSFVDYSGYQFYVGVDLQFQMGGHKFSLEDEGTYAWSSTTTAGQTADLTLYRDAANTLALRGGANGGNTGAGQTFRIYNTYTSASQYERAYLGWNNNTFEIGVGTAGISTARSISLVGAAGSNTGDTLQPLQINQTWTTGTGIATALTVNVTDTSSSSSSKLMDLRVNGSSKFDIDKSGNLRLSSGTGGNLSFTFSQLFLGSSTDGVNVQTGQTFTTLIKGSKAYGWCNTENAYTGPGLTLFRDADGILAQRGTTGPGSGDNTKLQQVFRIYNTWTNSTNSFERAQVGWSTNVFIVGTEKGSSIGTARPMHFQTDGTTRVAITTTGLVGIGTTNPQTKLEINGTLGFTTYFRYNATRTNILIGDATTGALVGSSFLANDNIYMGIGAGSSATGGYNNFFGRYAGGNGDGGAYNNFIGNYAGYQNADGASNNVFIGSGTGGYGPNQGSRNNFIGFYAGSNNTTGSYNNFFGSGGLSNTTGFYNTFFGAYSGSDNTTGSYNNFFGQRAGDRNTTGSHNIYVGGFSGISTSASRKVILGSGYNSSNLFDAPDTTKDTQFAVGIRTSSAPSKYWLVGDENFNVGIGTTNPKVRLQINGVLGFGTFKTSPSGPPLSNIRIGDETTGANLTTGYNNIFIGGGFGAGNKTTTGYRNIFLGPDAGRENTSGISNVFIGHLAGVFNTTGGSNVFVGSGAGYASTTGEYNTFFGSYSGYYHYEGDDNSFFGTFAGYNANGSYNNFFGRNAGRENQGNYNNFFGNRAGWDNSFGSYNNSFGAGSAYYNTTGTYNNFFGYYSGFRNTTGSNNIFFGSWTGASGTASRKVIIGSGNAYNQLFDAPDTTKDTQLAIGIRTSSAPSKYWLVGNENFNVGIGTTNPKVRLQIDGVLGFGTFTTFGQTRTNIRIGDETTGAKLTTGFDNIFMGVGAGNSTTTGYLNTFIGKDAGKSTTSGYNNNFFGDGAGWNNTSGISNVFIGHLAGFSNTTGVSNLFVGTGAGYASTTGEYNTFFGGYAGYYYYEGDNNSFFGAFAGYDANGSYNNFFGRNAGRVNRGNYNNFFGGYAGYQNTFGNYNNSFGTGSGYTNTTGTYNNFFGYYSGFSNTTGSNNIFFGSWTGASATASRKVILGSGYNYSNPFDTPDTTKDIQFAVGIRTDANPSKYWLVGNENFNVGIGTTNPKTKLEINGVLGFSTFTGFSNTQTTNIRIGDNTTGANITGVGQDNIFIGVGAGNSTTTGYWNTYIGRDAGRSNINGINNVFIGDQAGKISVGGGDNVFIGKLAGAYTTNNGSDIFIGKFAGKNSAGTSDNVFLGNSSGSSNTGNRNQFIGRNAGFYNTGSFNVIIGDGAGYVNNGFQNVFVGPFAGGDNTTGSYNNFFGNGSGSSNTTGSNNNFFGTYSAYSNTVGSYNNFFGTYSAYSNTVGSYNNFFGSDSGSSNTTGIYNIYLGSFNGSTTVSSRKVIIGSGNAYNQLFDAPDTTKDTQFAVGVRTSSAASKYWLVGDENFNVGIGTTNPTEKLSVTGNILINDTTTQGSFKATTATTSAVGIHSALSTSTYRSVEYTIQATEGSNFHATKILALHDGSFAYLTEYGTIYNNAPVSEFNADVSGGNIRLLATPASASSTNYTINFIATKI